MRHYARLDSDNVVTEVLCFGDSWDEYRVNEKFGKGTRLVETFLDMNDGVSDAGFNTAGRRYRYAFPGARYLPDHDVFTMPQIDPEDIPEGTSIVYDSSTYSYYVEYNDYDAIMQAVEAGQIDVPQEILDNSNTRMIYG